MSRSDTACAICGEVEDPTRIDWGCVGCNPSKTAAALRPEVPVSTGPADRSDGVGCLQHGLIGCERCSKLWTRHSLSGGWKQIEGGQGWQPDEDRGANGLGALLLLLMLLLLAGLAIWYVASNWPK